MKKKSFILLVFILLFVNYFAFRSGAQSSPDTTRINKPGKNTDCRQGEIWDLVRKKDKPPKPVKKFSALVYPKISYNPTNGFLFGAGGIFGWNFDPQATTKISGGIFTIAYTTKNQLIAYFKSNTYTANNRFYLQGDWRFYLYSQPDFGLGTNAPDTSGIPTTDQWMRADTRGYDGAFPMKFNYLKLDEIVNYKILDDFYIGLGYHLDYYYSIRDQLLNVDTVPNQVTPHYVYSKKYGFDTSHYALTGISLNIVYDSRDNLINPYKGIYATINYRNNFKFMGSSQNSSSLWTEFRTYIRLSEKKPRHLVAFWLFGDFVLTGHVPYLTLPFIGEDQRTRSGRGYVNSRFRGENLVYGEVEYRFPISPCTQILGGVLFVNATTASNHERNVGLFQYVQPAVGIGLRLMINKNFRTNVNFDFAIGSKSQGFYFDGQETF
jgi:hypothetical protein